MSGFFENFLLVNKIQKQTVRKEKLYILLSYIKRYSKNVDEIDIFIRLQLLINVIREKMLRGKWNSMF